MVGDLARGVGVPFEGEDEKAQKSENKNMTGHSQKEIFAHQHVFPGTLQCVPFLVESRIHRVECVRAEC